MEADAWRPVQEVNDNAHTHVPALQLPQLGDAADDSPCTSCESPAPCAVPIEASFYDRVNRIFRQREATVNDRRNHDGMPDN